MTAETTITTGVPFVTLVNTFTVEPEHQQELVDVLVAATDEIIQHRQGFISANIHVSTDGTRVVNYAQWESVEAMQAMLTDPESKKHTDAAGQIAESFDPHVYTVASVHHR